MHVASADENFEFDAVAGAKRLQIAMEKRKWLWKKKSSDRSPGDTESSGSLSSHSERFSDEQEGFKASPNNNNTQSPEVSSKALSNYEDITDSVKTLTEKLSAALVNVSAKEELVKQHAKVAEEAIAGWENAENEVAVMKQKLETATKHSAKLEDRVSHLDGALKECVRQLRQAKEEQEQKIHEAVSKATRELETAKLGLESRLVELQHKAEAFKPELPKTSTEFVLKIEALEKENSALKLELLSRLEELEIRTVERDLSTQAAEVASKQHLESIKKVAKLEAECRRLKAVACKSSSVTDQKSATTSSIYVESFTGSLSDSREQLNGMEIDNKKICGLDTNNRKSSFSDSWASALIAELDQFKTDKVIGRNLTACCADIDLMDDFLEMEQFAASNRIKSENLGLKSENIAKQSNDIENSLRAELEAMMHHTGELEEKLEKMERQTNELEIALTKSQENIMASELQLKETEAKLVEMQQELNVANEAKQLLESQLIGMKEEARALSAKIETLESEVERERTSSNQITAKFNELEEELSRKQEEAESKHHLESQLVSMETEAQTMSVKIDLLQSELERERSFSEKITAKCKGFEEELARKEQEAESKQLFESQLISLEAEARIMSAKVDSLESELERKRTLLEEIRVRCRELEEELSRRQEAELQQVAKSNAEATLKEEDLSVAAGKLAECQKTIASLGKQLESLATLEDFLIDTTSIPGFCSEGSMFPKAGAESWKVCSNESYSPRSEFQTPRLPGPGDNHGASITKNEGSSPHSSSSIVSSTPVVADKNRNGFAKFFTRSKNGIHLEI